MVPYSRFLIIHSINDVSTVDQNYQMLNSKPLKKLKENYRAFLIFFFFHVWCNLLNSPPIILCCLHNYEVYAAYLSANFFTCQIFLNLIVFCSYIIFEYSLIRFMYQYHNRFLFNFIEYLLCCINLFSNSDEEIVTNTVYSLGKCSKEGLHHILIL